MAYTVRKKRLVFVPRTGNGPCARRHVGEVDRRIIKSVVRGDVEYRLHATKGWRARRAQKATGA